MTIRWLMIAATAITLGLGAGCAQGDSSSCESASDCAAGAFCQAGACIAPCEDDEACSDSRRCIDGVCLDVDPCVDSDDCASGWVCESRGCVPQSAECATDRECPPAFRCIDGGCYPPDSVCSNASDCGPGETCDDGACVETDARDAGRGDTGAEPDISNGGDTADDAAVDTTSDDTIAADDTTVVADTRPETDECSGRDDGRLGARCDAASDCCNGMCLGNPEAGQGICTESCANWRDCNPIGVGGDELFCYALVSPALCAVSDYLDACTTADDCLGGRCLVSSSERRCSYDCDTTSDCAPGAACGYVAFGDPEDPTLLSVCTPVGATCFASSDCVSGTCLTPDEGGAGYCSVFCDPAVSACPAGYRCDSPDPTLPGVAVCVR